MRHTGSSQSLTPENEHRLPSPPSPAGSWPTPHRGVRQSFRQPYRRPRVVHAADRQADAQEAQAWPRPPEERLPALEWIGEDGRSIAKQFGELKVVRPMPVGCDGKTSGVVMIVSFATGSAPQKKMQVKLNADTTVTFDQQAAD